jgi:hypothetical protein
VKFLSTNPRQAYVSERFARRVAVEILVALLGATLIGCAIWCDQRWVDRHFLPSFFAPHRTFVVATAVGRIVLALLGVMFALVVRPKIGRLFACVPVRTLLADIARVSLAVVLALGASEIILRRTFNRSTEERPPSEVPNRRPDQRLGWSFVPAHVGYGKIGGRVIEYAFDPAGYRVRGANVKVDPDLPTVVFTGESIVVGQGLTWEESIPGQVEALAGTQTANVGVSGFASDQAYLRLVAELPRFRRPVAVVSLFTPGLFDRNLDDDRPHLGLGLVWLPAKPRWRLTALTKWLVPYRNDAAIERGIATTSALLRATIDFAQAHGAIPVIVVPQFSPEEPTERILRQRILDDAKLPYLWVELDPNWHVPGDAHPDARAAHKIAVAIANLLWRP